MSDATEEADMSAFGGTDEAVRQMLDRFLTAIAHGMKYILQAEPDDLSARIETRNDCFVNVDQSVKPVWIASEEAGVIGDSWNTFCETPKMAGNPEDDAPENWGPLGGEDSNGDPNYDAIWIQAGINPYGDTGDECLFAVVIRKGLRAESEIIRDHLTNEVVYEGPSEVVEALGFETIGMAPLSSVSVNHADTGAFLLALRATVAQYRKVHPLQREFDFSDRDAKKAAAKVRAYGPRGTTV